MILQKSVSAAEMGPLPPLPYPQKVGCPPSPGVGGTNNRVIRGIGLFLILVLFSFLLVANHNTSMS
jgi:hypothetical protein